VVYICLGIFALDLLITIIATIDISDLSSKLKSLLSYEDKENNEKSEIVDIGNSGYNDLSKRLSDVRSKIDSINNPLRIKIRRILRGAPRTTMNFRKQYEQLKELPSNFRHEISDIQKDLKEHFFGDYDDIVH
ncbi:MAG: hypothetical protein LBH71_03275, partial [Oscillospiraceae bacterium]|jgi:hypothetical protein|nr:hypothetical protein [Oscillospiraceae bacterium]